jgi:calcineurin-like phosphoesterase family protein
MTNIFFTSDTHLGHKNIIKYCDRPFKDTDHMDEEIIRRWNETVPEDATVYLQGDIALGDIGVSLPKIARLNGHKIAIIVNHDMLFSTYSKSHRERFASAYADVFQEVIGEEGTTITLNGVEFRLSHFPYTGDHTPDDRHSAVRPVDGGMPLIHGHTHTTDKVTFSSKGTMQIHVGQDAWDFRPVSVEQIMQAMELY